MVGAKGSDYDPAALYSSRRDANSPSRGPAEFGPNSGAIYLSYWSNVDTKITGHWEWMDSAGLDQSCFS